MRFVNVLFGCGRHVRQFMNAEAVMLCDYFVDNDKGLQGTTWLGKPIYAPDKLLQEDRDELLIIISNLRNRAEIELQLRKMGFSDAQYIWAPNFNGNEKLPSLYSRQTLNRKVWTNALPTKCFDGRMRLAVDMVRWNDINYVVDLGAFKCRLKEFIPKGIDYYPFDAAPADDTVIRCDFNAEPPTLPTNRSLLRRGGAIFCLGTLQYIADWRKFAINCTQLADTIVFSVVSPYFRHEELLSVDIRRNLLYDYELILFMQSQNFQLKHAVEHYDTGCVVCHFENSGRSV